MSHPLHQQAIQLINQGQFVQAHPYLVQLVKDVPTHADGWFLLGIINLEVGQIPKAIQLIEKANGLAPSSEYLAHLARAYSLIGDLHQARQVAEKTPASHLSSALTLDTLGVALSRVGLHELALTYFNKAVENAPENPAFLYNQAVSLKFIGDFDSARQAFERAISINPNHYRAHYALSEIREDSKDIQILSRLQQAYTDADSVDAKLHLAHAMAREFERRHEYRCAFDALTDAKQAYLQHPKFASIDDSPLFDLAIRQLALPTSGGHSSAEPIFVLGMPRSGTTLVERILSSHSQVTSAGELQDFGMAVKHLSATPSRMVLDPETLQQAETIAPEILGQDYLSRTRVVTGKTPRFVDKLPFNFFYLGLIRRALPNAKIICLLREPLDTIIGNYRQLFSIQSPYYRYAYDIQHSAEFYGRFYHLAHQASRHLDNFLLLDYQQLVSDPEHQIRQLLTFCDLPFEAACLSAEQNTAPVSTASKVQVREAINTRSIGRWRRYADELAPAAAILQAQGIPFDA